jgi:hypothetical protein
MTYSEEQMKPISVVRSAGTAGLALAASIGLYAAPAFSGAMTGSIPAGTPFAIGPSPSGVPASCPFPNGDASFVFGSGSGVMYGTGNANGDWGGETLQGPAGFYENGVLIAEGHLTVWFGGGNNTRGQNENAFTVNYTGVDATGSVQIHVNGQTAFPANSSTGLPTANVLNVNVSCE